MNVAEKDQFSDFSFKPNFTPIFNSVHITKLKWNRPDFFKTVQPPTRSSKNQILVSYVVLDQTRIRFVAMEQKYQQSDKISCVSPWTALYRNIEKLFTL